jgi:hypothetical protein
MIDRKCDAGGYCKWKIIRAIDPFSKEEFIEVVCSKCGVTGEK